MLYDSLKYKDKLFGSDFTNLRSLLSDPITEIHIHYSISLPKWQIAALYLCLKQ